MKIGAIADSHDNLPMIRKAVELFNGRSDISLVVHAGDIIAPFALRELLKLRVPLKAVFGNNDGERVGLRSMLPEICEPPLTLEIGGRSVRIAHSRDGAGETDGLDVVVYGHDHKAGIQPGRPLKVNPGECCGYLSGRATVAVIDLDRLAAEIIELT